MVQQSARKPSGNIPHSDYSSLANVLQRLMNKTLNERGDRVIYITITTNGLGKKTRWILIVLALISNALGVLVAVW